MRFFFRSSRRTSGPGGGPLPPVLPDPDAAGDRPPPSAGSGGGDRVAELMTHWPALHRSARKLMRDPADSEDLAHDAFERALRSLDRFKAGTNMRAWLYTIMVRLARDQFRRRRIRRTDEIDIEMVPTPEDEPPPPAWSAVTPEQVRAALTGVSPVLRQVFELHELEHLAYLQIAGKLGIPVNTVASRLRRARERLRELLSEPDRGRAPVLKSV
jgi:RNA polymerase sigma-70 factor (ECF subfamily)